MALSLSRCGFGVINSQGVVGVAQLVERRSVAPNVAGSIPVSHPNFMAIIIEFNVIVSRKTEIDAKYPGGLAQFRADWLVRPPERWGEDEHLLGFCSMAGYYENVGKRLLACGIDVFETSEGEDPEHIVSRCGWLGCDVQSWDDGHFVRCWLKGCEPGEVAPFMPRL